MTTERVPAEVFPPGVFIREELAARGWTQAELVRRTGLPASTISPVVAGHRRISRAVAEGLATAFGGNAAYWLGLDILFRRMPLRAVCSQCEQAMYPQPSTRRYCGIPCRQRAWRQRRQQRENGKGEQGDDQGSQLWRRPADGGDGAARRAGHPPSP